VKRVLLVLVLIAAGLVGVAGPAPAAQSAGAHRVTYDKYSLMVDGRRVLLNAAEFHYFRLPAPELWRDILEKEKAAGFNAISVYFDWAYHSPAPGKYDFSGVRDVDRLLRTAGDVGLYVVARPGPYINAETTGGGFPAWLKLVPGRARSSAPGYTAAYRDWLGHIDPIIARHQVTHGGPVLLYNVENEYAANTDAAYMQDLQDTARAHGIDVPITTNVCCDAADWVSKWGDGPGAVQIPGVDDYPQSFDCANADTVWGPWGAGVTERIRADAPVFAAEFQAGAIDVNNAGYDACRELTGVDYMKYFQKNNVIVSGATAFNYYMGFGGTNFGWLGQPNDVYTSYDYGAAITEGRQLTAKYDEFKRQNYFLRDATSLTKTDAAPAPAVTTPGALAAPAVTAPIESAARVNPDDGTGYILMRNTSTQPVDTSINLTGQTLPVRLPGHDAKILVTGYALGAQRVVRSTSEILTHVSLKDRDVAVLYGDDGSRAVTDLAYASKPHVTVLDGTVASAYGNGELRLDYTHRGLARVLITGGGRKPVLLLLATAATAATFWQDGNVLVRGPYLVRSAADGRIRADTTTPGPIEAFGVPTLVVNGQRVPARRTSSGSLLGELPGPSPVQLPTLSAWQSRTEAFEAKPGFDDSRWTVADKTSSLSPFAPLTQPVLFSDEYGFHTGSVWYRGHFTATGTETTVDLNAITGRRGNYLVWLNGRYLGSAAGGVQADSDAPINPSPGAGSFPIPAGVLTAGKRATLAVLVQNMGHNDDWTADDNRFRQPRGLVGARVGAATIDWRIQGDIPDPVRGPLNTGGLYGEREGWTTSSARGWAAPSPSMQPGVTWYRTSFRTSLPAGQDTSVALRFDGVPPTGVRALVYLNGWNVGQYGAEIGPQTDFVLPTGVLKQTNVLAVAYVAAKPAVFTPPRLITLGTQRGGAAYRHDHGPQ
jgi:beta-galactosidase GanA